jgi:hypothetical protein
MIVQQLALAVAALFSGAALYITAVEQPARLGLDIRSLLKEWKPAYKRGTVMQAPLALLGFLLGLGAWWQTSNVLWIMGAILMLANWPFTVFVIMPTNNRLEAIEPDAAGAETILLVQRWGLLHAVRTFFGLAAVTVFFIASI